MKELTMREGEEVAEGGGYREGGERVRNWEEHGLGVVVGRVVWVGERRGGR